MNQRIIRAICCAALAAFLSPASMAGAAQKNVWMVTVPAARLYDSIPPKDKPLTLKDSDVYDAARVVHGNILEGTLKNKAWLQVKDKNTVIGYVAVSHVAALPGSFQPTEPQNYMVKGQDVVPWLMPGQFPLSDKAYRLAVVGVYDPDEEKPEPAKAFSLRRGTVVVSIGSASQNGKTWRLISFSDTKVHDLRYAEDYVTATAGLGGRFAWIPDDELQALSSYKPTAAGEPFDLNKLANVPNDQAYRRALSANGFYLDPRRLILGIKDSPEGPSYEDFLTQDDLIDLYNRQRADTCGFNMVAADSLGKFALQEGVLLPRFLTADLGLHTLHLLFDRSLQQVEEKALLPMTQKLVSALQDELNRVAPEYQKTALGPEAATTAKDYLDIANALLCGRSGDLSPRAAAEYSQIMAATGTQTSQLTGVDEPYSLYKPRGHYTLNENLTRYFRVMSLLGTMGFTLTADEKCVANTALTALFCRLLSAPEPSKIWNELNDPLTKLIGNSNTNTYLTFAKDVSDAGIEAFESKEAMESLADKLVQSAKKQLVSAVVSNEAQPPQFRLLGKRVTFDALTYTALTTPRLPAESSRCLPDPSDALAMLGSRAAAEVIKKYDDVAGYKDGWKKTADLWPEFSKENDTFYTNWLLTLQDYFTEEQPDEAFCHTEAWQWRKLYTAAASMAELKHDTILYAEESGAEMGDAGMALLSDPFPQPILRGYIEPQPKTFERLADACGRIVEFLDRFHLNSTDENESYAPRFLALADDFTHMAEICRRELTDSMTLEDYQWINSFCPPSVLPIGMFQSSSDDNNELLKMALIADVAMSGFADLYIGVGTPRRLVVFLDDRSGGARLAEGFTMSYYEFLAGGDDRLTDEEWKNLVYDEKSDLSNFDPSWADRINK